MLAIGQNGLEERMVPISLVLVNRFNFNIALKKALGVRQTHDRFVAFIGSLSQIALPISTKGLRITD